MRGWAAGEDEEGASSLRLRLPALPESVPRVRRAIRELCLVLGVGSAVSADVELAVTEACSNVVTHAYRELDRPGEFEVDAERLADELHVVVRDHGVGLVRRTDSPGLGIGLPLIQRVTSRMEVRRLGAHQATEVSMWFPASDGRDPLAPS